MHLTVHKYACLNASQSEKLKRLEIHLSAHHVCCKSKTCRSPDAHDLASGSLLEEVCAATIECSVSPINSFQHHSAAGYISAFLAYIKAGPSFPLIIGSTVITSHESSACSLHQDSVMDCDPSKSHWVSPWSEEPHTSPLPLIAHSSSCSLISGTQT